MNAHAPIAKPERSEILAAFAEDLTLLARLHARELTPELLAALRNARFPHCLALDATDEESRNAFQVMNDALQGEEGAADGAQFDLLLADYAAIYCNHTYSVSPCECVWLDPEGLVMQEPMFEVRRWYDHYHMQARDWRVHSDDHLVLQLEFIAHLLNHPLEHGPKDAAAFMDHHVLRWIEHFAARVARRCHTAFYAGLALVTAVALKRLRRELVDLAGMPEIELLPIEEEQQRRRAAAQAEAAKFVPGAAPSW
jgi:TorA maturation chaperone TorD